MDAIFSAENLIALATLAGLEIVLGIDNIVFIAILAGKLPASQQAAARRVGLLGAMVTRILLLLGISWLMGLTRPLFEVGATALSGKDLILLVGGLFLIAKATWEIHHKVTGDAHAAGTGPAPAVASFTAVVAQIMAVDIVFSLDSVITAVGMANALWVMIAAVIAAVAVMMLVAGPITRFIDKNPALKMLALSFLLLIGTLLTAEGLHQHIDKGYVYFAMAFSLGVELLNMRAGARPAAVA